MSSSTVWKVWCGFSCCGNCEPERTAFDAVEPGQLPERVAQSVIKTTVSLPSCQHTQSTRWQCRRSLTKSISEETPYFTGLTVTRNPAWNARKDTSCHGEQIQTKAPRQLREHSSSNSSAVAYELTAGVCEVAPTPSPQESVEEGCGQTHQVDCKTTTNVHVRQQPLAQPRKPRAKELPP